MHKYTAKIAILLLLLSAFLVAPEPGASAYYNAHNWHRNPCDNLKGGSWVFIPGDTYWTNSFCVMKFEAKNVSSVPTSQASGVPWVGPTQPQALSYCQSLGANYGLVTNLQRMVLATHLAAQPTNWTGGSVGSGKMYTGHSDNNPASACQGSDDPTLAFVQSTCTPATQGTSTLETRRIHYTSAGDVIWDVAGNVHEWLDYYNLSSHPTPLLMVSPYWQQYTAMSGTTTMPKSHLVPTNAVKSWWTDTWNSTQGVGNIMTLDNSKYGYGMMGGAFDNGANVGLFAFIFQESTMTFAGFRCTYNL